MKNQLLFLLLTSSSIFSQTNIIPKALLQKDLPKQFVYSGHFVKALQWKDIVGENVLLISETGIYKSGENRNAELFAYHFVNGNAKPDWKVYDFEKDCPVDVEAAFVADAIEVTDLDKDNIAEVWLLYKTACRGDISPRIMKIIMHEGLQKHAMRGEEQLIMDGQVTGGEYEFDTAFKNAPKAMRDFALKQWKSYGKMKI